MGFITPKLNYDPMSAENYWYLIPDRKRKFTKRHTCGRGHEYTNESQYTDKLGKRHCRQCNKIRRIATEEREEHARLKQLSKISKTL